MKKKLAAVCAAMLVFSGCGQAESAETSQTENVSPAVTAAGETAADTPTAETETTEQTTTTTAETTTTTTTTPTLVSTSAEPEQDTPYSIENGCIVAYQGTPQVRAMEQYYFSEETGDYLADCVEQYSAAVSSGVNTYLMMIPTSQEFYTPVDLKNDYSDQAESAEYVYSALKNAKSVPIDALLDEHKAEYLYSRSDYHWQPLAAFYAARTFANTADVPFANFDTYEPVEREGYLGAFYSVNDIYQLEEYPDTFTYYKPENLDSIKTIYHDTWFSEDGGIESSLFFEDNDIGSSYTVFVGTDDTILEVDTDVNNDRVLVIFKDSYGNALVPFLTSSFSKIYLCDNRFFNINSVDFANEVGATDVLFALGAASTTSYEKISLIEQNMQNW